MARDIHDHYFKMAKKQGYHSRAAFKLLEIDERRHVLKKGDAVLDCGAAPGSWTQVVLQRIKAHGKIVAVDLQPIKTNPDDRLHAIEGDFTTISADELLLFIQKPAHTGDGKLRLFDVVLSDMAPSTTGDRLIDHYGSIRLCEAVLDRAADVLRPGGRLVMKVFEGEAYPALIKRCKNMFDSVKGYRPQASRDESTEMFITAEGFRRPTGE